jgi:GNAT superfamily N-acetyltransferase
VSTSRSVVPDHRPPGGVVLLRAGGLSSRQRTRFRERFVGSGPSPVYAGTVLDVAETRPSELLLAVDRAAGGDGDPGQGSGRVPGGVLGRVLISACAGRSAAALGLFEAVSGAAGDGAATRLISAALEWAREHRLTEVYAPMDVNSWFSYRAPLPPEDGSAGVAGGPAPPLRFWEPSHRPEQLDRFRRLGFEDFERFRTLRIGMPLSGGPTLADVLRDTGRAWRAAVAADVRFERLANLALLPPLMDELHPLCMEAFRDNSLFEPVPLDLFHALYLKGAAGVDATFTHWARNRDGRLVGFVYAFADGEDVVIKTIAVAPSARGAHLSTALVHVVVATANARGFRGVTSALVREDNTSRFLSRPFELPGVERWTRDYVLLRKPCVR